MHARRWILSGLLLGSRIVSAGAGELVYPPADRTDRVDVLHGVEVADPYRWLESDPSESTSAATWLDSEARLTHEVLASSAARGEISARLRRLRDYEKYTPPVRAGGRLFYFKNDGLQPFYVLYRQDSGDSEPVVLIDPNRWSEDGSLALESVVFSHDGRYVAYSVAESGSDDRTWRVLEIATGRLLADELSGLRYFDVTWGPEGSGLFYGRFDAVPGADPGSGENEPGLHRLYFHRLGTPQAEDEVVYERPDEPDWLFSPAVTDDGSGLVVTILRGSEKRYRIVYFDLAAAKREPTVLVDDFENEYTLVGNEGSRLFFLTDLDAPRRRIVAIDAHRPGHEEWQEVVSAAEETLESADRVGDYLVASYLQDARPRVRVFSLSGEWVRDVELPGIGSAFGFSGRSSEPDTFYYFSSFDTPARVYRFDPKTGESTLFRQAETDFDPEDYEVRQVFYPSRDGTRIPMFLAHRSGLRFDTPRPTLLYGYGGFGTSMVPSFQASRLAWMEMGGVFALANIRGGGEYGEAWHQAGTRGERQTVFDDFIAAAEYLIESGQTSPAKLAIQGRSGGGLLVAAVLTQRPDLFGAALAEYPVTDMMRFHLAGAGRFWTEEFGDPEDAADFHALSAYSPYHRALQSRHVYPATLVTTAEGDDRVPPWHAYKLVAALQAAQPAGGAPVLLRVEGRAGHGVGTPTERRIAYEADLLTFLKERLGM